MAYHAKLPEAPPFRLGSGSLEKYVVDFFQEHAYC